MNHNLDKDCCACGNKHTKRFVRDNDYIWCPFWPIVYNPNETVRSSTQFSGFCVYNLKNIPEDLEHDPNQVYMIYKVSTKFDSSILDFKPIRQRENVIRCQLLDVQFVSDPSQYTQFHVDNFPLTRGKDVLSSFPAYRQYFLYTHESFRAFYDHICNHNYLSNRAKQTFVTVSTEEVLSLEASISREYYPGINGPKWKKPTPVEEPTDDSSVEEFLDAESPAPLDCESSSFDCILDEGESESEIVPLVFEPVDVAVMMASFEVCNRMLMFVAYIDKYYTRVALNPIVYPGGVLPPDIKEFCGRYDFDQLSVPPDWTFFVDQCLEADNVIGFNADVCRYPHEGDLSLRAPTLQRLSRSLPVATSHTFRSVRKKGDYSPGVLDCRYDWTPDMVSAIVRSLLGENTLLAIRDPGGSMEFPFAGHVVDYFPYDPDGSSALAVGSSPHIFTRGIFDGAGRWLWNQLDGVLDANLKAFGPSVVAERSTQHVKISVARDLSCGRTFPLEKEEVITKIPRWFFSLIGKSSCVKLWNVNGSSKEEILKNPSYFHLWLGRWDWAYDDDYTHCTLGFKSFRLLIPLELWRSKKFKLKVRPEFVVSCFTGIKRQDVPHVIRGAYVLLPTCLTDIRDRTIRDGYFI